MKRRRKVLDANTSIRGKDGSRINTHTRSLLVRAIESAFLSFLPARSLDLSLSLFLASYHPPFLSVSLLLSRLVDPKYQRTIKYSPDDSFVTDERQEARAI